MYALQSLALEYADFLISFHNILEVSGPYQGIPLTARDRERVIRHVAIHDNFVSKGYQYHKLPEFDRLDHQRYDPGGAQSSLQVSEVDRLLGILNDIDQPKKYEHRTHSTDSSPFSAADEVFYTARLIQSTLHIYMYDAAITVIEHLREYRRHSLSLQVLLMDAVETAEFSSRVILAQYVGSKFSRPHQPQAVEHLETLKDVLDDMLDHISAQVLRLLSWAVEGDEWEHSSVALLARMISKLKLIGKDPNQWAVQSIKKGKSLEACVGIRAQDFYNKNVRSDSTFTTLSQTSLRRALVVDEITPTVRYFKAMFKLRGLLTSVFRAILGGICGPERSDFEAQKNEPSYEINNIVFANPEQPLWSTFNNRQKQTAVTSDETILRFCSAGWRLALRDMSTIPENQSSHFGSGMATVDWQGDSVCTTNTGRRSGRFEIHSAADYVSVHVLVALSSVFVARPLREMLMLSAAYAEQDKYPRMYPSDRFEMKFSIVAGNNGDEYSASDRDYSPLSDFSLPAREEKPDPPETLPKAYKSSIFRFWKPRESSCATRSYTKSDPEAVIEPQTTRDSASPLSNQYSKWRATMDKWDYDTGCIIIPCKQYVLTILAAWVIVVVGGLVLLFVLRLRAVGFDPSNILIFLWTIASFAIVLAKSWYVNEWSWNQFIQCQMPCRGVQELSRASKVPQQVLLLHLYRTACSRASRTKLRTRGPYNGIFPMRGRDQAHGFAIDCAFTMETLLASGLLVLKVNGFDGVSLVCIGGRGGLESGGWQFGCQSKRLICRLGQQNEASKSEDMELFFKEENFTWQVGDGLYRNDRARFG